MIKPFAAYDVDFGYTLYVYILCTNIHLHAHILKNAEKLLLHLRRGEWPAIEVRTSATCRILVWLWT